MEAIGAQKAAIGVVKGSTATAVGTGTKIAACTEDKYRATGAGTETRAIGESYSQNLDDVGVRKPLRYFLARVHHLSELGAANGQRLLVLGHHVHGYVLVDARYVREVLELQNGNADLSRIFANKLLRIVGT